MAVVWRLSGGRWDGCDVSEEDLRQIADLLRGRNAIDARIAGIIGRPMTTGHLGEWIAAAVFEIELERSAVAKGIDGRFTSGPLSGQTVNLKWYLKREGLLDINTAAELHYYLVLTGPASPALSSRGAVRPWCIAAVYLFDARELLTHLTARGVKVGVASSVRSAQWAAAEIYPQARSHTLRLRPEQRELLQLFAPA